ncbi:MAG: DNA recombination protein RmuC [Fidelibacterota bacterium]
MTTIYGIILFLIGFALGGLIIWYFRKREVDTLQTGHEQLKTEFSSLSREALDQNLEMFLTIAEGKFSELLKSSDGKLEEKKKLIDSTLADMKAHLKALSDRTSELKGQMEASKHGISELKDTTAQLRQILSSSQARGQWGERMVEDILNFIGFSEGINYVKQSQAGEDRPDFTFYLPDQKLIHMDVKFPLSHYENYLASENEGEQEAEKKAFITDVHNHVKEIAKRSYIDPTKGTVDYVLMFIPNESIYSFLNQEDHELIDFSLSKKILLCSPVTLYAILSLIRQAVSNFSMEQKAGEMQNLVTVFRAQWEKFVVKLEALGKSLVTVTKHYDDLSGPRLRQLEKPMDKIKDLQLGQEMEKPTLKDEKS